MHKAKALVKALVKARSTLVIAQKGPGVAPLAIDALHCGTFGDGAVGKPIIRMVSGTYKPIFNQVFCEMVLMVGPEAAKCARSNRTGRLRRPEHQAVGAIAVCNII